MKIDKFIIRIYTKLRNLMIKIFGNEKKSFKIIKIIICLLFTSNYYYYIADRGVPEIVAIILLSFLSYIVLTTLVYLSKRLLTLLRRIKRENFLLFSLLYYLLYKFINYISSDAFLEEKEVYIITLILTSMIFLFSKSLAAVIFSKKKLSFIFLILSLISGGYLFIFLLGDGESYEDYKNLNSGPKEITSQVETSSKTFFYGEDEQKTTNLLSYVNYSGNTKKVRDKYFKTTLANAPIKGKVWYPEGKEKSPVLFMIHGNHRFTEENYLGYEYLGRYLARRGIAFVSVDENILNGFFKFGLKNENDARAILLLENIKYTLDKNKDPKSEFYNLFDEDKICLAGHSRGGEAVVIAENYNKLNYNPDNGGRLNYNFNLKGIISVSPTVDQYNPSDKNLELKNINFMTIHGSHDNDVTGFSGMKIYENTKISEEDKFKTAIYLSNANHGQFNERWGRADADPPYSLLINKKALMPEKKQEEILSELTYEFLKNSFGLKESKDIFKNLHDYNLSDSIFYSRYEDGSFNNICDFEDDYNLETFKLGKVKFNNFDLKDSIYESDVSVGGTYINNTGLNLKLYNDSEYELIFDQYIEAKDFLQMDILVKNKDDEFSDLDFDIEISDLENNKASINFKNKDELRGKRKVEISKLQNITNQYEYKSSYNTIRIPNKNFENGIIDLNRIKKIKFKFKSSNNKIIIDNIGYSN